MQDTGSSINVFLSLKLENEIFAINVFKVLEVLDHQHITKLPNAPQYIKGVINFRGAILPVIETREKLHMLPRENSDKIVIIVLDVQHGNRNFMLAAIVDEVKDVLKIKDSDILPVPEIGCDYNTEFIEGMILSDNGFIMLLNSDRILTVDDRDNYFYSHEDDYVCKA